ncbi:SidA/IucD/PvdA family monooxygenase [Cronobacter dublinensis]
MTTQMHYAGDIPGNETEYDIIGIGFGPANIALAIALEEFGFKGKCLFLERRDGPCWQPQMLLSGSDIQNHPARDLVTPRNPRSRYTFLNFLFEKNRLFEHLNLGLEFPLRREFAEYVTWVAQAFSHQVKYGQNVTRISLDKSATPQRYQIETADGAVWRARALVVAPGRTPLIPEVFTRASRDRVFHLTSYLESLEKLNARRPLRRIAVVGGSQSAVEILLHLRQSWPQVEVINIQRGYGFRLKDTSPFSEHVYFPEFVDYYFSSSAAAKQNINRHLHYTNYSSADKDVIHQLYVGLYEDKLAGQQRVQILANQQITGYRETASGCTLHLTDSHTHRQQTVSDLDGVVLATGFRNLGNGESEELCPPLLSELYPMIETQESGFLKINRDYSLSSRPGCALPPLFLNGLCESSHGYGDAGSFSLLSLRAKDIWMSLSPLLQEQEVPV